MTALELATKVAARQPILRAWLASGRADEDGAVARLRGLRNALTEGERMALRSIAARAIPAPERQLALVPHYTPFVPSPAPAPTPPVASAPARVPARMPTPAWSGPVGDAEMRLRDQMIEVHINPQSSLLTRIADVCRQRGGRFRQLKAGAWWDVPVAELDALVGDLALLHVAPPSLAHVRTILAGRAAELAQAVLATSSVDLVVPAAIKLYGHQDAGIRFLLARPRCLLADDQGLGKTLQTLIAINTVGPGKRWLVLAPKTLVQNWFVEAKKWTPRISASMARGGAPCADTSLVFCSIDSAKVVGGPLYRSLLDRRWDGLIIDESHLCAKPTSKRWKAAKAIAAKSERVWLLSGTPMQNRPMDLFGLLRLTGHELGADRHRYGMRYCAAKQGGYGWDYSGSSNVGELAERLSAWVLRRTKDEVLDLPPKIRSECWCDVPASVAAARPRTIDALMRDRAALAKAKIDATWERVRSGIDAGEKVIVFTEYLAVIAELRERAKTADIGAVHVDGSVTGRDRAEAVRRLQEDDGVRLFIGQTIAAGVGITLTAATQVVFNDLCLVPAYHAQAEDRAYRIGTTQRIVVSYILGDCPLDEKLWALLARKINVIKSWEGDLVDTDDAAASLANALIAKLG